MMNPRFLFALIPCLTFMAAGTAQASNLDARIHNLVMGAEPGAVAFGELREDRAPKKRYKRDWNVDLHKDTCYVFGVAGDAGIERITMYLYDPSDDKVEKDSSKTNDALIKHCAYESGTYRVHVNIKRGQGTFALGIYSKENADIATLKKRLDRAAKNAVPGARPVGEPFAARGESGVFSDRESEWQVSLVKGKCYAVVAAGADTVRGLKVKLLDPNGEEAVPEERGVTHLSTSFCPGRSGSFKLIGAVTKGDGGYLVGLYNKGASDAQVEAAVTKLRNKATGGFNGCPNRKDPGCKKVRDGEKPMDADAYADVVGEMRRQDDDDERIDHLRAEMINHYVTVRQLSHILSFISKDSDKLQIVEAAAPRVVDPENSSVIRNGFGWKHMGKKAQKKIKSGADG